MASKRIILTNSKCESSRSRKKFNGFKDESCRRWRLDESRCAKTRTSQADSRSEMRTTSGYAMVPWCHRFQWISFGCFFLSEIGCTKFDGLSFLPAFTYIYMFSEVYFVFRQNHVNVECIFMISEPGVVEMLLKRPGLVPQLWDYPTW